MKLHITTSAKEELEKRNDNKNRYVVLWYDTEGCGCGVNGVPTVRFTDDYTETFTEIESDSFPVLIQKHQIVFFAESMKLDSINGMLRLSSPEGILNPFIAPQSICEI
ncbi:iron-sulfur cluster biosynthesis family protein [Oceanobacillus manasiensis]|uniref:iron-sulfur cluster biosynthesis family protein n=1 Tax=Oceanobacillus manasiensis TaxID=586413 RepID=UPI0005A822B3|nr:iron-sulfur cluster biosynthesis family protein [Oceanobacillus manasiensis]